MTVRLVECDRGDVVRIVLSRAAARELREGVRRQWVEAADALHDAGAEDLRGDGAQLEVVSPPEAHDAVLEALHKAAIETASAQIAMLPKNTIRLEGKNAGSMLRLAEAVSYAGRLSKGLVDATMLDEIERAGYVESIDRSSPDAPAPRDTFSGPRDAQAPIAGSWRSVSVHEADRSVIRPVGVRIDSGGLGKGMAADIAAEAMRGLELFSVECSGDLRIGGSDGEERSIEVASPVEGEGPIARILLSEGAIATSGVTRRSWQKTDGESAHHLIDPRTGEPADTGLVQVTAIAPTALEAEVRTKAALLSGPDEAAEWLVHGGLVVTGEGDIHTFGENVKTGVPA